MTDYLKTAVNLQNLQHTSRFLRESGLKEDYLDTSEVISYCPFMLELNPAEAVFLTQKRDMSEGLHDMRSDKLGIDYAIVTVQAPDWHIRDTIKQKVVGQLGLK